jgi:flagellin
MAQMITTDPTAKAVQRDAPASDPPPAPANGQQPLERGASSARENAGVLALAERLNAQVRGMNVAIRNASEGASMALTAESALARIGERLTRMRELAVRSASAGDSERESLLDEFRRLQAELGAIAVGTQFNGLPLLTTTRSFHFQVGASATEDRRVTVAGTSILGACTISAAVEDTQAAIDSIDFALAQANTTRRSFATARGLCESAIANLELTSAARSAARDRIVDALSPTPSRD